MVEKIIFITLFGLVWGSFLNVVIHRLPRGESLVHPPSTCPQCGKRIRSYDNIPVVSFIILGGRCRFCRARIPATYPLIEVLTPACFLILFFTFGLSVHFLASCLFTMFLIGLAFIDFFHQILPDVLTLPGLALALIYAFIRKDMSILQALLGAGVGAGVLLLVYGAYYLLRKKEGLGLGDVVMMLFIGAYLGWLSSLFTIILASFLGTMAAVFFLLFKKKDLQYALPFGTFLAPSAFIALVWGDRIITAYLARFDLAL
ncbi:MAG: prepilin peptidase [Candidatus Aminicenantes bacterium]|nr:prepilin peptidase [Candidatus Aminicenantes bacterium]